MNPDCVHAERITVKTPKMGETSCVCKVKYDGMPLDIKLCGVRILKVKNPDSRDMYIQLKPTKVDIKAISKLEKSFVQIAIDNTQSWFGHRMKPALIDEYFTSNIILDDKFGNTFKCRLEDPFDDIKQLKDSCDVVDIVLRVNCLRFFKQSFGIGYKIVEVIKTEPNFLFTDDTYSSTTDDCDTIDDVDVGPDACELRALAEDLVKQAEAYKNELESVVQELTVMTSTVEMDKITLKHITDMHEVLGKISEKYFVTYK